jgi:hypothetical protein
LIATFISSDISNDHAHTKKQSNHGNSSGRAYPWLFLCPQPMILPSATGIPFPRPNATIEHPHITRGSSGSIVILRQRFGHRRAESKPPPPAADNIFATTPSTDPQPPSPASVRAIFIGLSVETEKIEVRLTASRYLILFKCTFSPRRIAAGDNATTLPSPGPQTPLIVHI